MPLRVPRDAHQPITSRGGEFKAWPNSLCKTLRRHLSEELTVPPFLQSWPTFTLRRLLKVQNWSKMAENMANATASTLNNLDKYTPSEYTQHLDNLQQEQCKKEVGNLSSLDSYSTPEAVFTSLTGAKMTDLQYPGIHATRTEIPTKIRRSIQESSKTFTWIQTLYWKLGRQPNDVACPHQKALRGDTKVRTSNHLTACTCHTDDNQHVAVITDLF